MRSARFGLGRVLLDNSATLVVIHGIEECESADLSGRSAAQALDHEQWTIP